MYDQGRQTPVKRITGLLIVGLFSFLIISCTAQPNSDSQLRIGTNVWSGYEPLYLARELGYFQDQQVRLVELSSTSQVLQAYRNGLIDAAALTLDEAILLLSQGYQPRIVLVMDISSGADAIISRSEIKNMTELAGKEVGVENTALGAFMLGRALELNGMTPNQIKIVPLTIDKQLSAFQRGKVDAVVTFEPVKTALKKRLGGNVLFDSSQIPGEIVDVLVIRKQFLEQNPKSVADIKEAWYRALSYFSDHTNKAATIISSRLGLTPVEVLTSFDGLVLPSKLESDQLLRHKNGSGPELLNTATKLNKLMLKQGVTPHSGDLGTLFPIMDHKQL